MEAGEARATRSPWRVPGELGVEEWFGLNAQADDGSRYELIDGSLIVSPAPLPMHPWIGGNLRAALQEAAPEDLVVKPAKYAEAAIPHFWRIETNPFRGQAADRLPVIFTHRLDEDGRYQLTHRIGAGDEIAVGEPFKVTVDPGALARM